jgi:lipid-binding SYLF domain-containing protein
VKLSPRIREISNTRSKTVKISTVRGAPKARVIFLARLACVTALATPAAETNKEKQRKQIRDMAQDTLQRLYKAEPKTEAAAKHAFGYAVFSDPGVKILFAGTGSGKGIAVNNRDKHEIFMKMLEAQAGLGMGIDKFRVVFVFDNEKAFESFVNSGWEFGGQSRVAAKTEDQGGAMAGSVAVSDGVWMYQLTDKGLAVEISATGTKYYKNDDLN